MSFDYLDNYLFGYVGVGYLSMSDQSLKAGAGVAQLASDKDVLKYLENLSNNNFGDNAGDAKSIQDGINAYKESTK